MRTLTIQEFHNELRAQGVPMKHLAFRCPMCKTIQSPVDLMRAGLSKEDWELYLGFDCVGRFTGAGPHKNGTSPGRGCDWSLGGLFGIHQVTVLDYYGKPHPRFEVCTPEEAQAHMAANNLLEARG